MRRNNGYATSIDTFRAMGHFLGYARVSTGDQEVQLQLDALTNAGYYRVFTDTVTGALESPPELDKLLDQIRPGDTRVDWRLDRLAGSIRHLINHMDTLQQQGIEFKSLQENIDTSSSGGRLVFNIFASLAEFEPQSSCCSTSWPCPWVPSDSSTWPPKKPTATATESSPSNSRALNTLEALPNSECRYLNPTPQLTGMS